MTPGAVLYRGAGGDAERHSHYAIQVMASLDRPFELELESGERRRGRVALVPSGHSHTLRCHSERLLLALIEPFGRRGRQLHAVAQRATGQQAERMLLPLVEQWSSALDPSELIDKLYRAMSPSAATRPLVLSPPVQVAVQYIESTLHAQPRLGQAAEVAHISPSHLTHRFTREVGIPFRRYALWVRLRRAAESVTSGSTITDAAAAAGFSDSGHLSRVFTSNFGLAPSALFAMQHSREGWPGARERRKVQGLRSGPT